MKIYQ